jgi:hypothetical protein
VIEFRPGYFVELDLLGDVPRATCCVLCYFLSLIVPVMHEFINVLDLLIVHELYLKFGEIRCELIFNQSVLVVIQSVAF